VSRNSRIDFDKVKPAYLTVEKPDLSKMTPEILREFIEEELKPKTTERFPGYVRGTIDLNSKSR
jgi:hypothetical protein